MAEPYQANAVLVGKKPVMNYVLAAIRLFTEGANEVILKARGQNISKAVDAAERIRKTFLKDVIIKDIKIDSENIEAPNGRVKRIPVIEIVLSRGEAPPGES